MSGEYASAPRLCGCGCGAAVRGKFVRGHHMRLPGAHPPPASLTARIEANSEIDPVTGCWLWRLHVDADGYGSIKVAGHTRCTTRVSYEAFIGVVPEGHIVSPTCGVHRCVRPDHLEAITHSERYQRSGADPLVIFGAYYEARRAATHCPNGHRWDEDNTRYAPLSGGGWQRVCRTCVRDTMRTRRADAELAEAERERNRELYAMNADTIRARKSVQSKARYAAARAAGRCTARRCAEDAEPGRSKCRTHLQESSARTWGIKQFPLVDIYADRGLATCWLCLGAFTVDNPLWHDHLIPRSLGGPDEPWNFAPAHRSCNIRRQNIPLLDTIARWHPSGLTPLLHTFLGEAIDKAVAM